jgi:hypothetical protein
MGGRVGWGWIRQNGGGNRIGFLTTKPIDMARSVAADSGLREPQWRPYGIRPENQYISLHVRRRCRDH